MKWENPASMHCLTPSALQRNAIQMAYRWWADSGPLFDVNWEQTEFEDIKRETLVWFLKNYPDAIDLGDNRYDIYCELSANDSYGI